MKTRQQLQAMKVEAEQKLDYHAKIRREHIESGYTPDCDYFNHHTRMWEFYRGRVNCLMEILNDG